MSREGVQIDEIARQERLKAARALLMHPLLTSEKPDPSILPLVRRHSKQLTEWFADHLGYRLVVEPDVARLYKLPPPIPTSRRTATLRGHPCSARHYSLLCLLLAGLDGVESQTTLGRLAEQVRMYTLADDELEILDLNDRRDRRTFVDVVGLAAELGCIEFRDGDEESYVAGSGDALYDVHPRRLAHVLAVRVPPSGLESPNDLVPDTYPDTDDGRRRRIRHRLMRQLCEEPVLYYDDLGSTELDYLRSQRSFLARQIHNVLGLELEIRQEGMACIDADGDASDLTFPGTGTYPHAALLLAEEMARRVARSGDDVFDPAQVRSIVEDLIERYGRYWRAEVRDGAAGARRLMEDCLQRLQDVGLIRLDERGVMVRPAIARFSVTVSEPGQEASA